MLLSASLTRRVFCCASSIHAGLLGASFIYPMVLTGCATVLALRLLLLLCSMIEGSRVSFEGILTIASLVSIIVSVSRLTGASFGTLVLFSLTGDAKSCTLSGEGATALLGFSFIGGILGLSLVTLLMVIVSDFSSVFIGELLIGLSFTCSNKFGSWRCGLGDGVGMIGVFSGLSRICLFINADTLNFLLLSVRVNSGDWSIVSIGVLSIEFRFSTALAAILALDDCCGRSRRCCTICSAFCNSFDLANCAVAEGSTIEVPCSSSVCRKSDRFVVAFRRFIFFCRTALIVCSLRAESRD